MTSPPQRSARQAVVPLLRVALGLQAARLVVAVISGIVASTDHFPGADTGVGPLESGAERLLQFANAGDGLGVVVMLIAAVLLWLAAMLPRSERPWGADYAATCWLLVLTAVSAALTGVGYLWVASDQRYFPAGQEVQFVGVALTYAVVSMALLFFVRGVNVAVTQSPTATLDEDEDGAAVFAVDRKTGAVLAWPSPAVARAKAPLYGVEDDEYAWFLDDGTVLHATANGQDVRFEPTGEERSDELLQHLKDYAQRRDITIDDEEADEPLAYVDAISRDHYLEMWPGWLRWLGRLSR